MKALFVINEAFPLYKIGGLGDVGGSLPHSLQQINTDIAIVLPKHPEIIIKDHWSLEQEFSIIYDRESLPVRVIKGHMPDSQVPVYLIEEKKYLSQHTDAADNHADKYAVFSLAVCQWQQITTHKADLIHLNDWHTALIPIINQHLFHQTHPKYLITIHNLMYQGSTNTPIIQKLGIDPSSCQIISWDNQDNHINILLEGLLHAHAINAVSPQYAKEILTDEYGEKINEILALRKQDIHGILNGLNLTAFDPQTDAMIFQNYTLADYPQGKNINKLMLQQELNLEQDRDSLMIGFVGRIDARQKGIQLIIEAISTQRLVTHGQQFVFLGVGDPMLESELHQAAENKYNVRIITRFDEPLSHKIYAASDLLLIPSKFEPCGLIQMIANRYGTIPVANATGGLIDTITHQHNGFLFNQFSTSAMLETLQIAIQAFQNPDQKHQLITNAMSKSFSWHDSARKYQALYRSILETK